jgi:O-antigen/teichoic acid export membrane protein
LFWALSKVADAGSDALYGLFMQSERLDYMGFSLVLRGLLAIAGVAALFRVSHSAPLALAGLAVAWGAALVLFDTPMARSLLRQRGQSAHASGMSGETLRPVLDQRQLWPLCWEAAPLGIVAFLLAVQIQAPRYVVAGLLHARELGLFSAAAYLTFTGTVLVNALCAPASVRLAQNHVAGMYSSFRQLMVKLVLFAGVLGIAAILVSACAGARILTLLYTSEYAGMAGILVMLCAAGALSCVGSALGYGMTALRRYRIQVPIFLAVVLITLLSCYLLTVRWGLMGTAVGILAGNLAQVLMSATVVIRTVRRGSAHSNLATVAACEHGRLVAS